MFSARLDILTLSWELNEISEVGLCIVYWLVDQETFGGDDLDLQDLPRRAELVFTEADPGQFEDHTTGGIDRDIFATDGFLGSIEAGHIWTDLEFESFVSEEGLVASTEDVIIHVLGEAEPFGLALDTFVFDVLLRVFEELHHLLGPLDVHEGNGLIFDGRRKDYGCRLNTERFFEVDNEKPRLGVLDDWLVRKAGVINGSECLHH